MLPKDDDAKLLVWLAIVILASMLTALGGCHESEKTARTAIEKGLVQKPNMGSTGSYWGKP